MGGRIKVAKLVLSTLKNDLLRRATNGVSAVKDGLKKRKEAKRE